MVADHSITFMLPLATHRVNTHRSSHANYLLTLDRWRICSRTDCSRSARSAKMFQRRLPLLAMSLVVCLVAVWLGGLLHGDPANATWREVAPGVWRTVDVPFGYA